jgi:hypothetical protein
MVRHIDLTYVGPTCQRRQRQWAQPGSGGRNAAVRGYAGKGKTKHAPRLRVELSTCHN